MSAVQQLNIFSFAWANFEELSFKFFLSKTKPSQFLLE